MGVRVSILVVAIAATALACGPHDDGSGRDLSPSIDLGPALGCDAYVKCLDACPTSGPDSGSCSATCTARVTASGLEKLDDILRCSQAACGATPDTTPDMGSPCRYDPTTYVFDDPDLCEACQRQQLVMGTCTTQQDACAADTVGE